MLKTRRRFSAKKVGIKCDVPSFLAYYDACSAGLSQADPHLIFGGPASDGKKAFLFALVDHCLNGTNAITVRKTPFFAPFIYKNDHVTKTGSGQT